MADEKQPEAQATPPAPPQKKSNKTLFIVLGVVGGLLACIVIVAGGLIFMGKKAVDTASEKIEEAGKDLGVEKTDKGYKYKDKKSGSETEAGDDVALPDDWPADLPVYEGKIKYVNSGKNSRSASLITSDDSKTVQAFYKAEMEKNGWKNSSTGNYSGTMSISYQKGKRYGTVMIAKDTTDESKNMVTVSESSY